MLDNLLNILTEKIDFITFFSGCILPIVIIWLNSHYNLKQKEQEKKLEIKYSSKNEIKTQEKAVFSSLSRILFDVQILHVSLSGSCVDHNCIDLAVVKFDESLVKYHEEISKNLLKMPSVVINDIYNFYKKISELKIELKLLNEAKEYELAHVAVYLSSRELAYIVMDIQEFFIKDDGVFEMYQERRTRI